MHPSEVTELSVDPTWRSGKSMWREYAFKSWEWSQSREHTALNMYTWTWCVYKRCKPACILWPQNIVSVCMLCGTKAPEGPGPLICVTLTALLKPAEADVGAQRSDHPGERVKPEDNERWNVCFQSFKFRQFRKLLNFFFVRVKHSTFS